MEGSAYTQRTLDFVRELHRQPGCAGRVGTVLQAYMHRTMDDAKLLVSEGIRIRLCKGAYQEPPEIAFQPKPEVDANYVRVAKYLLKSGVFHGLATHDQAIITEIKHWVKAEGIAPGAFEFQMLHGIRRDLQEQLAREGWGMRVYIPFGTELVSVLDAAARRASGQCLVYCQEPAPWMSGSPQQRQFIIRNSGDNHGERQTGFAKGIGVFILPMPARA
jgi:proline dehydrogenase